MSGRSVELRSDTFTRPSPAMRGAMAEAEVGDDVWGEDPTVHALEARAASTLGKDAGLFVSSGTQGNLVALLSHTQRGDEIIVGDQSHIFRYEVGGAAVVGALQVHALPNDARGRLDSDEVRDAIRGGDIHEPRTGCIALENTHNRCGGAVLSVEYVAEIAGIAHEHDVPVHLDGARIFNAAVALGVPPGIMAAPVDSVTFCLSKGLAAPVGSVLCGTERFIARARKWRKLLGGGMRQAGILASAGLFALDNDIDQLAIDHANARLLANGLARLPGIGIDPNAVESNIVFFDVDGLDLGMPAFLAALNEKGVRLGAAGKRIRAVTSAEVDSDGIEYALAAIESIVREPAPAIS